MKKELRKKVTNSLNQLSDQQFTQSSLLIKDKVLKEHSIIEGNTIAVTISNKREVDTKEIIKSLWKLGKNVAVPKCNPKNHTMTFYIIESFNQLETVYMDLKEPKIDCTIPVSLEDISCIIVPGIVFDQFGYRIGYGGGYYDRYLSTFKGETISLAFELQVVDKVPTEVYDLPVDIILTEKCRINCIENRRNIRNENND